MAINKTINKSTKSHGAMKNCIEYVLKENKTKQELTFVTGPFAPDQINYDTVYNAFLDEKKLWNKDSGRMYNHNVISWHKDENITLEEAFEFGKEFAEKWFEGFQTLIGVHKDRDHVHLHLVTNTVSYEDGHKIHNTKKDLELMKELTNQMCLERGFTVAQKGKDFFGEKLEVGTIIVWSKDKYHLLQNEAKDSYLASCAYAYMDTMEDCSGKDDFIEKMENRGWRVTWKKSRKHITFEDKDGKKVRDTNLSKTFNFNITKEVLIHEFERQKTNRSVTKSEDELEQYYRYVEAVVGEDGTGSPESDGGEKCVEAGIEECDIEVPEKNEGNGGEATRSPSSEGEGNRAKSSVRSKLEIYRETVEQRERDKPVAEQTHMRPRRRTR